MRNCRALCLIGLALILCATSIYAQGVTSGTISGQVKDSEGKPLPGATVTAVHEPTGTRYVVTSRQDGRFSIPNARVGGPYTVTSELEGFESQSQSNLSVSLGQDTFVQMEMRLKEFTDVVTVVSSSEFINPNKTGNATQVSERQIEELPTIGRGLEDFARTNPFVTITSQNEDPNAITVAGRNNRYNNIQIDGSVNNDLFGLAAQGTPGGQADTTPISLDAIQELQMVVSAYDVRQGGFSGGSVNAITRSGTNDLKGSVFYYTRDDSYVGDGPDQLGKFGTFSDDQYGFRLGGSFVKDKAFFFVNGEWDRKTTPTGWSIDGSGGQAFDNGAAIDAATTFTNILSSKYGYDAGGLGQNSRDTNSDKYFGRLDFNLSDNHQLTVRHNYVDASNVVNRPNSGVYEFPGEGYLFKDKTHSTVAQINSVFSSNMFNEGRIAIQTIKDRRGGVGQPFPHIEIWDVLPNRDFQAGTEQYSTYNFLDQDILEITDDFTWLKGNHSFIFGTHNELFKFNNGFLKDYYGSYVFYSLANFEAGIANRYYHTVVPPGQPSSDKFKVNQYGLYAGDTWNAKPNLTFTYGLRVDIPYFPDKPGYNPIPDQLFGYTTSQIPNGNALWSPRAGFNWDINSDGKSQLRGGLGVFSGRTPYVWISNNYGQNGLEKLYIYRSGSVPFNPDPFGQSASTVGASTGEFNLIDPNFKFPQVLRFDLAYDRELPWWGLRGTVEAIYGKTLEDIDYKNLNLMQVSSRFDGRPVFAPVDSSVQGAYLITNTTKGKQSNIALKIEKPYTNGFSASLSYVYGDATAVNDGSSSQAVSNWQYNEAVDPNNAPLSTSDYQVRHRITATASYQFNRDTRWPTTVSMYYNRQSGRPYSIIYGFQNYQSINLDGFYYNDLWYVPSGPNDVIITGGTWDQLDAFIKADSCLNSHRGQIAPRNCDEAPWYDTMDIHLAQQIPIRMVNAEVTFDILNFLNLFDKNAGVLNYVPYGTLSPTGVSIDSKTGKYIYSLNSIVTDPANNAKFDTHNIESRWRAKLGLRLSF